jgi:hypothetical protein
MQTKTAHQRLESIAAKLEREANGLDRIVAGNVRPGVGHFSKMEEAEGKEDALALRRAADIIRHQIECEA